MNDLYVVVVITAAAVILVWGIARAFLADREARPKPRTFQVVAVRPLGRPDPDSHPWKEKEAPPAPPDLRGLTWDQTGLESGPKHDFVTREPVYPAQPTLPAMPDRDGPRSRQPVKRGRPRHPKTGGFGVMIELRSAEPIKPTLPKTQTILEGLSYPLEIRYRDAKGVETDRPITAMKLVGRPIDNGNMRPMTLYAYCEKRNAVRAFLLSRIIETIDGETGEVLQDIVGRLTEVAAMRAAQAAAKQGVRH